MEHSKLAQLGIDLDKGEAVLTPETTDHTIRYVMLLTEEHSAAKLGRTLNMTPRSVQRYRAGDVHPTVRTFIRILNRLGYDVVVRKK